MPTNIGRQCKQAGLIHAHCCATQCLSVDMPSYAHNFTRFLYTCHMIVLHVTLQAFRYAHIILILIRHFILTAERRHT